MFRKSIGHSKNYPVSTVQQLDAYINYMDEMGGIQITQDLFEQTVSPEMQILYYLLTQGGTAIQRGMWPDAIDIYNRILRSAPNFVAPRVNLAACLRNIGLHSQALEHLQIAAQLAPTDQATWASMATTFLNLNRTTSAIQAYENAINVDPESPRTAGILIDLGYLYLNLAPDLDRAEEAFHRALTIINRNLLPGLNDRAWAKELFAVYLDLSRVAHRRGDWHQEIQFLEKTLAVNPSDSQARDLLQNARNGALVEELQKEGLFPPGDIYISDQAVSALQRSGSDLATFLRRHINGDWGDVDDDTSQHNQLSVQYNLDVRSTYRAEDGTMFFVTTYLAMGEMGAQTEITLSCEQEGNSSHLSGLYFREVYRD
jgi:tetratricopeptide (TPR) repeat protein